MVAVAVTVAKTFPVWVVYTLLWEDLAHLQEEEAEAEPPPPHPTPSLQAAAVTQYRQDSRW